MLQRERERIFYLLRHPQMAARAGAGPDWARSFLLVSRVGAGAHTPAASLHFSRLHSRVSDGRWSSWNLHWHDRQRPTTVFQALGHESAMSQSPEAALDSAPHIS